MRLIAIVLFFVAPLAAQWLNYPDARTPRSKDGKPNLTAPAPRSNGKIDLSGVWQAERTPESEFIRVLGPDAVKLQVDLNDVAKYAVDIFWGLKPEEEPLRPEAVALLQQRRNAIDYPPTRCLPMGIPAALLVYTFKMIQTPQEVVVLHDSQDPPRQIYLDGRSLPKDPQPSWMGYSVAKWIGDTLTVETNGLTEASWMDLFGHPRSESMHVRESYHRRDFGHMDLEVTFDDSKYYTRPFSFKTTLELQPDSDVLEFVCGENEKDRAHLGGQ